MNNIELTKLIEKANIIGLVVTTKQSICSIMHYDTETGLCASFKYENSEALISLWQVTDTGRNKSAPPIVVETASEAEDLLLGWVSSRYNWSNIGEKTKTKV